MLPITKLDLAFLITILLHLYIAPYTKVEESFNLQAVHDLITYGLFDISQYDHQVFPGAVKRTFAGAIALSTVLKPLLFIIKPLVMPFDIQLLTRAFLGVINWIAFVNFRNSIRDISGGAPLPLFYALLQYSQFHITYYASRTLPNFMALPLTNFSLSLFVKADYFNALGILAFAAAIFRAEIGVYAVSLAFAAILFHRIPLLKTSVYMVSYGVLGLVVTVIVDSYFWGKFPCVPELESMIFNVFNGNSKLWGVEPFNVYFTKYFMSIFCPPTVLLFGILGLFVDGTIERRGGTIRTIGIGSLLYVFLLSFQPHKEWRFIAYAIPGLTLLGSNGAVGFGRLLRRPVLVKTLVVISALMSVILSSAMLYISSLNYPGGVAIQALNDMLSEIDHTMIDSSWQKREILVHMDVPACMTGVTLFTELAPHQLSHFSVKYDKNEDETILKNADTWKQYDYVITDINGASLASYTTNEIAQKLQTAESFTWNQIVAVKGFAGINISPVLHIIRNHHLALRLIKDVLHGEFSFVIKTKESIIVENEALYIYARQDL